jgi:hypothetical protein
VGIFCIFMPLGTAFSFIPFIGPTVSSVIGLIALAVALVVGAALYLFVAGLTRRSNSVLDQYLAGV